MYLLAGAIVGDGGQAQTFSDAWFKENTFFTEYPDLEIPEHLADLPNLYGSGLAKPILQAAAESSSLAALLRQMADGPPQPDTQGLAAKFYLDA